MHSELPFYEELNVIKTHYSFREYAMSYNVEIVEKKDPIKQLGASKLSIKDLLSDLLNETNGFKYQITLKVTLTKYKPMEKLNLDQFILIQQQKQWQIINLVSKILFNKFCTVLISGLMTDLPGLLNYLSLNTLTFQLKDH